MVSCNESDKFFSVCCCVFEDFAESNHALECKYDF